MLRRLFTNRRTSLVLALGAATYVAAWTFGSKPLYPVAVGLVAGAVLARVAVLFAARPVALRRRTAAADLSEGDDAVIELELELGRRFAPSSVTVIERAPRLGERATSVEGQGGLLHARYVVPRVPRGRYAFEPPVAVFEDPFGLERREVKLEPGPPLLVYPRVVELERLFSDAGAYAQDGHRLLLRRPTGFELHSVREYEQGESLRKVHWPSTARRGQLMVKELEDSPQDEVAVVLDCGVASVGEPPDSSFDLQVRAAASLLWAHVRRGRRSLLVVDSATRETQRVESVGAGWRRALELLASIEPTGGPRAGTALADESGEAARALDLVVLTARLAPALVDRLVQRAVAHRGTALVYVDARTFAREGTTRTLALGDAGALLRLQGAGVRVAVVRRGDDLARVLGAQQHPAGVASA